MCPSRRGRRHTGWWHSLQTRLLRALHRIDQALLMLCSHGAHDLVSAVRALATCALFPLLKPTAEVRETLAVVVHHLRHISG